MVAAVQYYEAGFFGPQSDSLVVRNVRSALGKTKVPTGRAFGRANGTVVVNQGSTGFTDGDTLTITDGPNTVVYEFDKSGDGVAATHTAIVIGTNLTASQVRGEILSALGTSIAAGDLFLEKVPSGSDTIRLITYFRGPRGINALAASSAIPGAMTVVGMRLDPNGDTESPRRLVRWGLSRGVAIERERLPSLEVL